MAWNKKYDNDSDEKNIAYDLRQVYVKLVGEHLLDVSLTRKAQNFYDWFKALEDLYTITCFKFNEKDDSEIQYNELRKKVIGLSVKYSATWVGKTKNPEQTKEIDSALRELEEYLYFKMEDSGIWGQGYTYDEDEI